MNGEAAGGGGEVESNGEKDTNVASFADADLQTIYPRGFSFRRNLWSDRGFTPSSGVAPPTLVGKLSSGLWVGK